jgi:hypothetical protein
VSGAPAFQQVGGVNNVGRIGFGANTYSVEPAIAINPSGEIGLGFMESDTIGGAVNVATAGFLSTFVTARKATDAAGAMQPVVLVPAGTGTGIITGRIGDFSGMNVDPVNGTFWHVNEFGGGGPTVIANFSPETRPLVTAPSDQFATEGTSKAFALGSFADPDGSPWSVDVNWGDGTPHTIFSTAAVGSLGTKLHTFAEEGLETVTVTVTDFTGLSDARTFQVTVSDPAVIATGGKVVNATEGADSGSQTVATFIDPGGNEPLSSYSAVIDWGDGTTSGGLISGPVAGVYTVVGNHTYAVGTGNPADFGNTFCDTGVPGYDRAITVTISHESATDAFAVSDAAISLTPATAHLAGGNLIILGTTGKDKIDVTKDDHVVNGAKVKINDVNLGTFSVGAGGWIVIAGMDGDDDLEVHDDVKINAAIYGGPGKDKLEGGGGQNIVVGCDGNDEIEGGKLNDLLIGGMDADKLSGKEGDDILVAGIVTSGGVEDSNFGHLQAILGGAAFTAADDGAVDEVHGEGGNDIFYVHVTGGGVLDKTDRKSIETLVNI